jgi:orotate phosphoribosyltransferase
VDVKKELEKVGCIYTGHFVGVSKKHLGGYCNIDPLLPHVKLVEELIKQIALNFKDDDVETVASPAIGAIPFSHWGAHHLMGSSGKEIFGVWADKVSATPEREFTFEREGFAKAIKGKRVLIIEDMINQMTSIKAMIKTVRDAGGIVVGVGSVACNRGVSAEALDVPKFVKLCGVEYDAWTAEDCALNGPCAKGEPVVIDIGHGDDFKKERPRYKGGYVKLLS